MLVSEPFYGHVWSFLRESNTGYCKLNLSYLCPYAVKCGIWPLSR